VEEPEEATLSLFKHRWRHISILEALVEAGGDINAVNTNTGNTPLTFAAASLGPHSATQDMCASEGINVFEWSSPLHILLQEKAAQSKRLEMVMGLLRLKADPNTPAMNTMPALHVILNAASGDGSKPMPYFGKEEEEVELMAALLEAKADVQMATNAACTYSEGPRCRESILVCGSRAPSRQSSQPPQGPGQRLPAQHEFDRIGDRREWRFPHWGTICDS